MKVADNGLDRNQHKAVMNVILFEDTAAKQLAPASLTKPTWAIRCASFRLIDWIEAIASHVSSFVRPHLQTLQLNNWPQLSKAPEPAPASAEDIVLMVNARLAPTVANAKRLESFVAAHALDANDTNSKPDKIVLVRSGWAVAAAIIPKAFATLVSQDTETDRFSELTSLANDNDCNVISADVAFKLLDYPHDIIGCHMESCGAAVAHRINRGNYREVGPNVFVAKSDQQTVIPESAVFDTSEGPIVFEAGVKIGPFCFFRGPVHVGKNTKISEHSSIKDSVAISHTCKMGGEIEGVQTEPWSNKQHFGFLGHSYIGSWINLGAGTCNSDLKNTYGTVNMVYGDRKVSTGMQFVGCVMGDYSRTAINTSIYTGKIIGVGSTVYGMTSQNVPSFVNCAQALNQFGVLPPEVLVSIQQRMFGRRNVTQRPCDIQLIHDVFTLTQNQRDGSWSTDPIAL